MSGVKEENRAEMKASIEAIGRIGERWSQHMRRKQLRLVLAKAFMYGLLVFIVMGAAGAAYLVALHGKPYFFSHIDDYGWYFFSVLILGVAITFVSLLLLRRSTLARIRELTDLVDQLRSPKGGHEEASKALAATRKILEVLPEIARPRYEEALVYAALTFLIAFFASYTLEGIFVALAVFLYFRWEGRKNYERELAKLEEQRKVFEEKMQSFAQSL